MNFISRGAENAALDTKDILFRLLNKHGIKQELVAYACGVDASQVSRWLNPAVGSYPPIYFIVGCLRSDIDLLQSVAHEYLNELELMAGRSAHPLQAAKPDGSMVDEFQDSVILDGEFGVAMKNNDLAKMEELAHRAQMISQRMLAEVKLARETEKRKQA